MLTHFLFQNIDKRKMVVPYKLTHSIYKYVSFFPGTLKKNEIDFRHFSLSIKCALLGVLSLNKTHAHVRALLHIRNKRQKKREYETKPECEDRFTHIYTLKFGPRTTRVDASIPEAQARDIPCDKQVVLYSSTPFFANEWQVASSPPCRL